MSLLILGIVIFFGIHLVPAKPELRDRLIGRVGKNGYLGVFVIVSAIGLILMLSGHHNAENVEVWSPPAGLKHVVFLFMLPVFVLLVAAYLPGKLRQKIPHPMLMAIKIWAFAHLLVNGDLASMLFFGSFLIYAVYDLISSKKRQRAGALTVKVGPARNDWIALGAGLGIYVLFLFWGHGALIGVPLLG